MFTLSRPHMRGYTFFPFLIGSCIGLISYAMTQSENWLTAWFWLKTYFDNILSDPIAVLLLLCMAFYFLFPANALIYWINDIFDYETDKNNKRKQSFSAILEPNQAATVTKQILCWNIPFFLVIALLWKLGWYQWFGMMIWLFSIFICLVLGYNAPPVRVKAIPFLDWLFKLQYLIPALIWYLWINGWIADFRPLALLIPMMWVLATHAFAAIPDMKADREGGLQTTTVLLWRQRTLVYVAILYFLATLLAFSILWLTAIIIGITYVTIVTVVLYRRHTVGVFTRFPWVNTMMLLIVCIQLVSYLWRIM